MNTNFSVTRDIKSLETRNIQETGNPRETNMEETDSQETNPSEEEN